MAERSVIIAEPYFVLILAIVNQADTLLHTHFLNDVVRSFGDELFGFVKRVILESKK